MRRNNLLGGAFGLQMEELKIGPEVRQKLIEAPDVILEDADLMRALVEANKTTQRGNIVDLRGVAMDRLESRLTRLEETHNTVIAAAYENLSGTQQVHRAVLALFDHQDFETFLHALGTEVNDLLRVSTTRLVLETNENEGGDALSRVSEVVQTSEPGFIDAYIGPDRAVALRPVPPGTTKIYGESSDWVASEACLRLDLGEGRYPAMLALASDDPQHFAPGQATDLLSFFGGVFEQVIRRWLG